MLVEDLTVFFNASGFGQSATMTIGTSTSTVNIIFDASYIDPLGAFEASAPVAWVQSSLATGIDHGSTLTVGTTPYTVVEVRPDGTGVTQLRLRG